MHSSLTMGYNFQLHHRSSDSINYGRFEVESKLRTGSESRNMCIEYIPGLIVRLAYLQFVHLVYL